METVRQTKSVSPAPSAEPDAVTDTPETNPLAESGGRFRDDPFWDEMQDSIRQHRREMDAQWDVPE